MHYKEYNVRVYSNEKIEWRNKDGKLHREDGPAIERASGIDGYFLNGKPLTEEEFNNRKNDPCDGKFVEIDGRKYKLVAE